MLKLHRIYCVSSASISEILSVQLRAERHQICLLGISCAFSLTAPILIPIKLDAALPIGAEYKGVPHSGQNA